MVLKIKVTFEEYIRLLFMLMYTKPLLIFIVSVDILLLTWIFVYYTSLMDVSEPSYYQFFATLLITVFQPTGFFYIIWRNYHSSNQLTEELEINLSPTLIKVRGDSFYMELLWDKIYKVIEMKNWFLIYQNTLSAVIIPKQSLSEEEVNQFISLLGTIPPNVRVKLKK